MEKRHWFCCAAGVLMLLVATAGCKKTDTGGRLGLSGTVTFQGQPLAQGTIEFSSLDSANAATTGGTIQNGQFSIDAQHGLPPGEYRVRVSSPEGGPAAGEMPGEATEVAKERIPPEYSGNESKLRATVQAGGKNHFEFAIP